MCRDMRAGMEQTWGKAGLKAKDEQEGKLLKETEGAVRK